MQIQVRQLIFNPDLLKCFITRNHEILQKKINDYNIDFISVDAAGTSVAAEKSSRENRGRKNSFQSEYIHDVL